MEKADCRWKETWRREKEMTLREKFRSSIKRGTGEAYLLIKKYPQIDFSNEILKTIIDTSQFDAQAEGTRERYFYDLVNVSKSKTILIKKIINLLKKGRKDTWAIEQLFNLCAMFAKVGNASAKQTVYSEYQKKRIDDTPWLGEKAVIGIDRKTGLEFLRKSNKYDYVNRSKDYYRKSKRTKINYKFSYNSIREYIDSGKRLFLPSIKSKFIDKSIIKKIAIDFIHERDFNNKLKYLNFFKWVKFPFQYQYLLYVLKKINANCISIEATVNSLKFFKGEDIRLLAVKKIRANYNSKCYLGLLIKNYQKGDASWLYPLVKKQNTPDKAHSIIWDIVDIYGKNNTKECKNIMEFLYNNLTCGPHRQDVVRILKANNILSRRIRNEIKFDSYLQTRKLA